MKRKERAVNLYLFNVLTVKKRPPPQCTLPCILLWFYWMMADINDINECIVLKALRSFINSVFKWITKCFIGYIFLALSFYHMQKSCTCAEIIFSILNNSIMMMKTKIFGWGFNGHYKISSSQLVVYRFSKNFEATSKLYAPNGWHAAASCLLVTH
jgi:hypothetical protein